MLRRKSLFILLLTGLCGYLFRCEETLPPRIMPENVLRLDGMEYAQGVDKSGLPYLAFLFKIHNSYTETFQERVKITGKMDLWFRSDPEIRTSLEISNGNLVPPSNFINGILTLDPGTNCFLHLNWNLYFDDGDYLPQMRQYGIAIVMMQAEFQIFEQLGYLKSNTYTIAYTAMGAAAQGPLCQPGFHEGVMKVLGNARQPGL